MNITLSRKPLPSVRNNWVPSTSASLLGSIGPIPRLGAYALASLCFLSTLSGQVQTFPSVTTTFEQAIQGFTVLHEYSFGTGYGRNISNLDQLATSFTPHGIAGTTVFNQQWQLYQPFNTQNFAFTNTSLNLTATIPRGGGLFPGGIYSGEIWSKEIYKPTYTGNTIYAVQVRMKVPSGPGMWPAAWFYTLQPGQDDGSEIDNPEFYMMKWQNQFDWTGFQHGPGQGSQIYSIKTNQWVWRPGLNFAADYHDYETLWTPDRVYKYVDGTLVYAQAFTWTARGPASLAVSLAVGSSDTANLPGLQPTSLSQFPSAILIEHITVWAK